MAPYNYKDIYKYGDTFSITQKFADWVGNPSWKEGYTYMVNPDMDDLGYFSEYTPFWKLVSAISEDVGADIYSKTRMFVQNIRDIDTCELYYLRAIAKELGYSGDLSFLNREFPTEIYNLLNIFSINKNILLKTPKVLHGLSRHTIYKNVSAEVPSGIFDAYSPSELDNDAEARLLALSGATSGTYYTSVSAYNDFINSVFSDCLSTFITLKYRPDELSDDPSLPIWEHIYLQLVDDNVFKTQRSLNMEIEERKINLKIRRDFNEKAIVDSLQEHNTVISDYTMPEREIIQLEMARRSKRRDKTEPLSKYAQERENKVKTYFKFVNTFNSDEHKGLSIYDVDTSYFELTGSTDYLLTNDGLNEYYINDSAFKLRNLALRISYLRDELKRLVYKHNITGTEMAISILTKDLIRKYVYDHHKWGYTVEGHDLISNREVSEHNSFDVNIVEYWDTTEYLNISTTETPYVCADQVNPRYWEEPTNVDLITPSDLSNFYKNVLGVAFETSATSISSNTYDEVLEDFLSHVFNSGAVSATNEDLTYTVTTTAVTAIDGMDWYAVTPDALGMTELSALSSTYYVPTTAVTLSTNDTSGITSVFTIHDEYWKDAFLKYSGTLSGKAPFANYKNKVHSSYAPHPYIKNFYQREHRLYGIPSVFNYALETSADAYSEEIIGERVDGYGNTIDSWRSGNVEVVGYRTNYENLTNETYLGAESINMDIDGPFNYYALSAYLYNAEDFIASARAGTNKYYDGIQLVNHAWVADQLEQWEQNIRTLSGKTVFKYTVDQYENHYMLFKDNNDFNEAGELWIRLNDHPLALPAISLSGESNHELAQFDLTDHNSALNYSSKIYDIGFHGIHLWMASDDPMSSRILFGEIGLTYNESLNRQILSFSKDNSHNFEMIDIPDNDKYVGTTVLNGAFNVVTVQSSRFKGLPLVRRDDYDRYQINITNTTFDPGAAGIARNSVRSVLVDYNEYIDFNDVQFNVINPWETITVSGTENEWIDGTLDHVGMYEFNNTFEEEFIDGTTLTPLTSAIMLDGPRLDTWRPSIISINSIGLSGLDVDLAYSGEYNGKGMWGTAIDDAILEWTTAGRWVVTNLRSGDTWAHLTGDDILPPKTGWSRSIGTNLPAPRLDWIEPVTHWTAHPDTTINQFNELELNIVNTIATSGRTGGASIALKGEQFGEGYHTITFRIGEYSTANTTVGLNIYEASSNTGHYVINNTKLTQLGEPLTVDPVGDANVNILLHKIFNPVDNPAGEFQSIQFYFDGTQDLVLQLYVSTVVPDATAYALVNDILIISKTTGIKNSWSSPTGDYLYWNDLSACWILDNQYAWVDKTWINRSDDDIPPASGWINMDESDTSTPIIYYSDDVIGPLTYSEFDSTWRNGIHSIRLDDTVWTVMSGNYIVAEAPYTGFTWTNGVIVNPTALYNSWKLEQAEQFISVAFESELPTQTLTNWVGHARNEGGSTTVDNLYVNNEYANYDNGITILDFNTRDLTYATDIYTNYLDQDSIHYFYPHTELGYYGLYGKGTYPSETNGDLLFSDHVKTNSLTQSAWYCQFINGARGSDPNVFVMDGATYPYIESDIKGTELTPPTSGAYRILEDIDVSTEGASSTSGSDTTNVGQIMVYDDYPLTFWYLQDETPNNRSFHLRNEDGSLLIEDMQVGIATSAEFIQNGIIRNIEVELINRKKRQFVIRALPATFREWSSLAWEYSDLSDGLNTVDLTGANWEIYNEEDVAESIFTSVEDQLANESLQSYDLYGYESVDADNYGFSDWAAISGEYLVKTESGDLRVTEYE